MQLEGRHAVLEALRAGRPLRKLVVARTAAGSGGLRAVIAEARRRGVPVHEVTPAVLARLATTRTPQGVIAYAAVRDTVDVDTLLEIARSRGEAPFVLVLDGIEDPGNLGAILRAADATGVHGVVIPRWRAVGLTPAVATASAGAVEHVAVAAAASLAQVVERLKRAGLWVVGADPAAAQALYEVPLRPPIAVVIGGEGRGLSRLVRERCDLLVRIPMYGRVASLNAAVAAALVLYEVRRQMQAAPAPA
ncbi:MAG: 23S rRNA (guanosine(2251)-2'-O)-methyltransferase RlmB [Firmicutes bacterium]|jgi:23S rRNA (guanosine2251-2'-O)-methyltransferase|nr:23S rRNA (guanosine(2251)-2'-O)-methyltransferase RlmB [Bacillota bacterium]